MESNNYSNVTSDYDYSDATNHSFTGPNIIHQITYVIISIGIPLTLVAIYSLYSQVQNNNVAPIFIINLLISDIIQLCFMIVEVAVPDWEISFFLFVIYDFIVLPSVGFMVCIALERYLLIAWPLWYHFRRTIKSSVVVCVVVWTLPFDFFFLAILWYEGSRIINIIFFFVPFPLLIFFLSGTLKSLSAAISVSSDEKRRIVVMLVLVLLTYTLLFLPSIIWYLAHEAIGLNFFLIRFSPLADLILYVFLRKGVIDKLLASLCCCRMDSDDNSRSSV